ncbi:MAG: hypothetical protein K5757_02165 [Bacteroidaceae bacterium]|nr:hypothetical protein [Bacteroidaceae bacterium]
MRKELYLKLCERLKTVGDGAIKYIDLWNHNVEFIEQEEQWERPAVFIEFQPIQWNAIQPGVEYRAEAVVNLHVVTDWQGSSSADSEFINDSLSVFELLEEIHSALTCMEGESFAEFDLVGSTTSHNHEELLESIETYQCVAFKHLD